MSASRNTKMNKVAALVLSIATVGAALATTTSSASAFPHMHGHHGHHGHHGWGGRGWGYGGAGLALGLLGAAAVGNSYGYGRTCTLQRQFDEDGNYLGRVRVCRRAYVD